MSEQQLLLLLCQLLYPQPLAPLHLSRLNLRLQIGSFVVHTMTHTHTTRSTGDGDGAGGVKSAIDGRLFYN